MAGEPFEGKEEGKKKEEAVAPAAADASAAAATAPETTTGEKSEVAPSTAEAGGGIGGAGGEETKTPGDEEDTGAQVAPIVRLEEVVISTGEENEEVLLDLKAKLYRFDKEGNQWKERGVGQVKLLRHKETRKVRLLMRQSRTLKICANHLVIPSITLQEHAGSEKSWVWYATDFSDGELKDELFCIRLGSVETAQKFKSAFEDAQDAARGIEAPEAPEVPDEEADEAADALGGLNVSEEPEEGATKEGATKEGATEQSAVDTKA